MREIDDRFRMTLEMGLQAAKVVVLRWRHAPDVVREIDKLIEQARHGPNVHRVPEIGDGEAEYLSWFPAAPTAAELEYQSWL